MSQALWKALEKPLPERQLDRWSLLETAGKPTRNCRETYLKLQESLLETAESGGSLLETAGGAYS